MPHQIGDQGRDIFGERMAIGGVVGDMDLADAGDLRSRLGHARHAFPSDEQMDLAELAPRSHDRQCRVLDCATFMFDPYKRLHAATPNTFNLPINSSTSATFTPAVRLLGSTTVKVFSRAATSTP